MNEADVRAQSHGVNESMSNTDSGKKQGPSCENIS